MIMCENRILCGLWSYRCLMHVAQENARKKQTVSRGEVQEDVGSEHYGRGCRCYRN